MKITSFALGTYLGNYGKKTTQSMQGAEKVILCRILQNFKQRLGIF